MTELQYESDSVVTFVIGVSVSGYQELCGVSIDCQLIWDLLHFTLLGLQTQNGVHKVPSYCCCLTLLCNTDSGDAPCRQFKLGFETAGSWLTN